MANSCNCSCSLYAIIASVIIGITAAVLRYTAIITVTPAFLWVALGIAVVYLLVTFAVFVTNDSVIKRCAGSALTVLLYALLAAILASVILLGASFAATSVTGSVLTGILLTASALAFSEVACLVKYSVGNVQ